MQVLARPLGLCVGDWLINQLLDPRWTTFRCATAFLKSSGAKYLVPPLYEFTRRPNTDARISVGIDSQGSTFEGVRDVWRVLHGFGQLSIVNEGHFGAGSFHPKVYLFENDHQAVVAAGSSNLTYGGLFLNHEFSFVLQFDDLHNPSYLDIIRTLDAWQTPSPYCMAATAGLINQLHDSNDLPSEEAQTISRRASRIGNSSYSKGGSLFGHSNLIQAPKPLPLPANLPEFPLVPATPVTHTSTTVVASANPTLVSASTVTTGNASSSQKALVIEVVPHHNGEVFLSMNAVKSNPGFFHFPFTGWTTPKNTSNNPYPMLYPSPVVEIIVYDNNGNILSQNPAHNLYVVYYEPKSEIRITIPDQPFKNIPPMSVLLMTPNPSAPLDYKLESYPPGAAPARIRRKLTNQLPSGGSPNPRSYGWV